MGQYLNQLGILKKGLDAAWLRAKVVSNNIANVDTPNFKASRVEFENVLKSHLKSPGALRMKVSNPKHLASGKNLAGKVEPMVVRDDSISMRLDGNNVDLENEMTELTKNNIMYQTLIQKTAKEIAKIKYAISEGKR